MSDSIGGGAQQTITDAAQRVAGGMHQAANEIQAAACTAHNGVGEVREVIRAQPITSALIVFTLGYIIGRIGSLIPSGHSTRHRS